jgi:GT2 family glycosyltransferase
MSFDKGSDDAGLKPSLGVVIIGRNEGERLKMSLGSISKLLPLVYVDSASSDGSPDFARAAGIPTLVLDEPPRLTAARARNEGLRLLLELHPQLEFVQMVDGDSNLANAWPDEAVSALKADERTAAVFGELRECRPEASLYNRMCEVEWNGPSGEVSSCGGIAMYRVSALTSAGGFDASLAAGEEPDLCLRLRTAGWLIRRLPVLMGHHDAELTSFAQWWRRAARGGYAYAALHQRHGRLGDPGWRRQLTSTLTWGGLLPAAILAIALASIVDGRTGLASALLILGIIAVQVFRIRKGPYRSWPTGSGMGAAALIMLAKFAQLQGMWRHWRQRT